MNSKERTLTTLNHEEPDRVPIDLWFTSEVEEALSREFGGLWIDRKQSDISWANIQTYYTVAYQFGRHSYK